MFVVLTPGISLCWVSFSSSDGFFFLRVVKFNLISRCNVATLYFFTTNYVFEDGSL